MFKLFGISNCDTVKKARLFLEKKNVPVEFMDFKKYAPTNQDIERWKKVFGGLPVNTKGVTYKKYKSVFEALSLDAQVKFIQEHTSMIKRPILEKQGKVVAFGFNEIVYKEIT